MYYWAVFTLLIVVVVKYYTAAEMHKLERRLERVKHDLQFVKQKLQDAQQHRSEAEAEEATYEDRFRRMLETIEDLQIRLSTSDEMEEETTVSRPLPLVSHAF